MIGMGEIDLFPKLQRVKPSADSEVKVSQPSIGQPQPALDCAGYGRSMYIDPILTSN